jgi:hypothetical protein
MFPLQSTKMKVSKGLVKISVNCLFVSMYFITMSSFLNMVSQEVVSHFYVFGSPMECWVFG